MTKYLPTDKEHIRVYGRTVETVPMPLFWTASGVEFVTNSTEAEIELEVDYQLNEVYIEVELDGCLYQRFAVPKGKNEYLLYQGFTSTDYRTVTVRMSCQPIQDDIARKLLIHSISLDGDVKPVSDKKMKIEFIGDSLTSGEGLTGKGNTDVWCAGIFGLQGHYGLTTAAHFDAEYSIVSQSGWGVVAAWDNNAKNIIPPYYTQVCGVLAGDMNRQLGAFKEHDFGSWQPDVVVINLGTNDGSAAESPAWTDPETGISYKQKKNPDGRLDDASKDRLETGVKDFLKKVRSCNPEARIIWAYGMCDHTMEDYIKEAVNGYMNGSGDEKTYYLSLPEAKPEQLGSHLHPGVMDHRAAADVLIEFIEKLV